VVQRRQIRLRVPSLASLSGLRIQCCCELWCRSQMRLILDDAVAVVEACSYSSYWTPSLGTSICHKCGPKKQKKKKADLQERKRTTFVNSLAIS